MNQKLQNILKILEQNKNLTPEEKESVLKALKDVGKELEITAFKLERTEKVKKTTAILLEETIKELEQKRKAVETQNRELEIEASLERVRAVAMGMNKSEDLLSICEIFFKELKKLGFNNLRNSLINIFNDKEESFVNYDYSDYMGGSISNVSYNNNPANDEFLIQIRRANDAFVETVIDGNQLDEWKEFRRSHGEQDDPRLDNINALYYYNYSIGSGSIGISNFNPISEEQQIILKRFRNVFNLSYQRYLDIALAEEQAREAQIEASLERVRAVAMSMNKSDDLLSICEISFKEFQKLGFDNLRNTIIHILNDEKGFFLDYDYSDYLGGSIYNIGYNSHPIVEDYLKKIKRADDAFAEVVIEGSQLEGWKNFRRSGGQRDDPRLDETHGLYYYLYSIGVGDIGISTFRPIDESQIKILQRFRNVFDLAYRRYTDITEAEAQAREAQIEAGLERVRSSAMAMHKSEQLPETAHVLFEQFKSLGKVPDRIGICIINEEVKEFELWGTDQIGSQIDHRFKGSLEEPTVMAKMYKAWKEGKDSNVIDLSGQALKKWIKYTREKVKLPVDDSQIKGRRVQHAAFFSQGILLFTSNDPAGDETMRLLVRFAKVFDQAYIRFLDLQKAEEQARESQIEAALERVRARTMAMHSSEELSEVITVVSDQLQHLKIRFDHVSFAINSDAEDYHFWTSLYGKPHPYELRVPYLDNPIANRAKEVRAKGLKFYQDTLTPEENREWLEHAFKHNPADYLSPKEKAYVLNRGFSRSFAMMPNIILAVGNYASKPYSEDDNQIIKRFAAVFEQSYTRFLDLQKAEAQAKEAQIEAALERVRAKAMAMHKSDDLTPAVATVFSELDRLGFRTVRCGIGIFNHLSKKVDVWTTSSDDKSGSVHLSGDEILEGHPLLDGIFEAWKLQEDYSYVLQGKELLDYYNIAANSNLPVSAPEGNSENNTQYYHCIMFPSGGLFAFRESEFSVDAKNLMRRFADVFQLTFTRHLDLRKAEAQAREAQIQLALERVRARTMAMHKSEELAETAAVLFQQMTELGVTPERLNICLIKEETKILEVWSTDQEGIKINHHFNASLDEPTTGKRVYDAWKQKKKSLVIDLSGQELNDWIRYVREVMGMTIKEELIKEHRIHSVAFFSHGMVLTTTAEPLPDESMNLLERFADVFNLTYTRFLDLKNAEAQTKEAKIEASLERVRSKAMAMHSPNDLSETVNVFFKELKTLGIIPIRCGVGQIDEATRTTSLTTTTSSQQGESFQVIGKVKQTGHAVLDGIFDNWKLQKEYHPVLQGEDIKAYYNVMNPQIGYPEYPEGVIQYGNSFPFKEGFVFAWTESKLSEEELQIFRRFTSVLSLTYRRYIDLKSAEVRAFDAIKQASLDRVRAEIASMRLTEDLNRITPIIWRELKTLEVPFFRCGVFIVDEGKAKVQVYLTTPDGKSLGVLNLSFDSNELTSKTVDYWRKKKVYKEHWNKEEFISWSKSMVELGQIQNTETYQGSANPPESLYLHFVPFAQGMLYVGDTSSLSEEKIELVKSLAESFSIAYSRYEDFDRLETAKKEVESAFGELDILSKELKIKNEELESENQRKALELEEARQLQLSMLPKELPKLSNLDIAVYMKTATEVGGDYYDFNVGADGTLTVAIGDATGHGMKAGTIVSMIKALFASGGSRMDMKSYFKESSDALKGIELGRLMMAFLMLRINSHKLQFANAGMPPLFIYRNRLKEVEEMMIHGMPLGAIKDFPYEISEIEISSGDTILLLSDGLPELKNERSQQYGYTQVKEKFKLAAEKSPDEIVEYLKNSAAEWVNRVEPDDDVTFVIIKIK